MGAPRHPTRRILLGAIASTVLILPRPARAGSDAVIRYPTWSADASAALDQLEALLDAVPAEQRKALEIARDSGGQLGVIGRFPIEPAELEALALSHARSLAEAADLEDPAALGVEVVEDRFEGVYNVSYGLGPNAAELVKRHRIVARLLGPGVAKHLVIEQTRAGNYALVYKRYGDLEGTRQAAARHDRLLSGHGLDASFIQEQHHRVVFDGSTAGIARVERPADPARAPAGEAEPQTEVDPPDARPAGRAEAEPESPWDPGRGDTELEDRIEALVKGHRKRGRVSSDEQTSWLVHDLREDRTLAAINASAPRQAASMVKPLILLAFFHEARRGRFIYGPISRGRFEAMIQRSSNSATNWTIDQLGGPRAVQRILDASYPNLLPQTRVVERIASNGRTYRNQASAADYARYLRALWRDELPYSAEQRRLLNLPGRDRLYSGAPSIPVGTAVYNKTGSTARLCGDMGVLVGRTTEGRALPYVLVGIIEKRRRASGYGSWISTRGDVIRHVSDLTYRWLQERHGLA